MKTKGELVHLFDNMKKRITSIVLATSLLLGLFPVLIPQVYAVRKATSTAEVTAMLNSWKGKLNGKYWNYYDRSQWDNRRTEVENNLKAVVNNGYLDAASPTNAQLGVTTTKCPGYDYAHGCKSNYFSGGWQCAGFAWFVEYALFQSTYQFSSSDWNVYTGSSLNGISLQPGDLVRVSGHSAVIGDVSGGSLNCVECWGGSATNNSGCKINWSTGFNDDQYSTPSALLTACKNNGGYVYRYKGLGNDSGYLAQCTEFASYLTAKTTKTTTIKSLPCSAGTNSDSTDVVTLSAGATFNVTAMYKNTANNYWYKGTTADGKAGYMFAGDAVVTEHLFSDLTISNVSAPSTLTQGSSYSLQGVVSSTYNNIRYVNGYIYSGTQTSGVYYYHGLATVNARSYSILNGDVDTALLFNELSIGNYNYVVTARPFHYSSPDGETIVQEVKTFQIYQKPFTVTTTSSDFPGTPELTGLNDTYSAGEWVAFTWNPTANTTHYNLYLYRRNDNDEYEKIENIFYAESGLTRAFDVGGYAVRLQSTNSNSWLDDHSTWKYTNAVERYFEVIENPCANGHDYSYTVTTAPTITSSGTLTGTCSVCGTTTTVTLPKLTTADYIYSVTTAASCTATGTGRYTWKVTAYGTYYFDVTIPKTPHTYVDTVTPPTCTAQGYTTHTCSVCGDTYRDAYTNALGHNYGYAVTTPPTVDVAGVLTGTCSRCGVTNAIALPKLTTTDYNYTVTKAATCTATGTARYTWKVTTYGTFYFDVTLPKTPHSYVDVVTPPTCTAQGYTTHTCSVCGDSYKDSYTNALGHAWDNGIVVTPPTETQTGVMLYTCTRCGATRTETIPVTGHVHSYTTTVVPPTCTEQGYTLHTCACGDSYKDNYTAALGHSFGNWTVTNPATCTASGTEKRTCSRCGLEETRSVAALGHAESGWIIDRNPTCTSSGSKHTECTRCGATLNTGIIPAKGHTEGAWITDRPATCTASGSKHTECSVCGATIQTAVIPALGHAWDGGVITKPATATEDGVKTYTCTRCGQTRTETIPKTGQTNPFVDVTEGKYYYTPVLWAFYHDPQVTGGVDATHFGPNKNCTREQIVTFLWKAAGAPEPTMTINPFSDVKETKYYYKAVLWAVQNGVTGGVGGDKFGVGRPCTREQAMTFLWKACGSLEPTSTANPFTDVIAGKYYYKAVLWAVENGVTGGVSASLFGVGRTCTRGQIVTFLYKAFGEG